MFTQIRIVNPFRSPGAHLDGCCNVYKHSAPPELVPMTVCPISIDL